MQDLQKTACEPGFAVFATVSASSSACWLAPPVAGQPAGHPVFLKRKTATGWLTWRLKSPAQLSPSAAQQGSARTTEGSKPGKNCSANIKSRLVPQSSSAVFATNPTIQISLSYKAERVAGHLLLLSCHQPCVVNGGMLHLEWEDNQGCLTKKSLLQVNSSLWYHNFQPY